MSLKSVKLLCFYMTHGVFSQRILVGLWCWWVRMGSSGLLFTFLLEVTCWPSCLAWRLAYYPGGNWSPHSGPRRAKWVSSLYSASLFAIGCSKSSLRESQTQKCYCWKQTNKKKTIAYLVVYMITLKSNGKKVMFRVSLDATTHIKPYLSRLRSYLC